SPSSGFHPLPSRTKRERTDRAASLGFGGDRGVGTSPQGVQQSTAGLTFGGTGKKLDGGQARMEPAPERRADGLEVQHQSPICRLDGRDDAGDSRGDDGRAFMAGRG